MSLAGWGWAAPAFGVCGVLYCNMRLQVTVYKELMSHDGYTLGVAWPQPSCPLGEQVAHCSKANLYRAHPAGVAALGCCCWCLSTTAVVLVPHVVLRLAGCLDHPWPPFVEIRCSTFVQVRVVWRRPLVYLKACAGLSPSSAGLFYADIRSMRPTLRRHLAANGCV